MCAAAVSGRTRTYVVHASDFHMPNCFIVCGSEPPANAAVACPALNDAVLPRRLIRLPNARRCWVVVLPVLPRRDTRGNIAVSWWKRVSRMRTARTGHTVSPGRSATHGDGPFQCFPDAVHSTLLLS